MQLDELTFRGDLTLRNLFTVAMLFLIFGFLALEPSLAQEWHISTVDSDGRVGMYSSIALDSRDYPHISYYDLENRDLKYAYWTGDAWVIQIVDAEGDLGRYTSLALDGCDRPHITYYYETDEDLRYAYWTGGAWVVQTVESAGILGKFSSIVLDEYNYPHISYFHYTDGLKYARWTGTVWDIQIVDGEDLAGAYSSIALDGQGYPHITYSHYSADTFYALRYARWADGGWEIQYVADYAGEYTSLALDGQDYPHIASTYNDGVRDLQYTCWTGSVWEFQTLDEDLGDFARFISLALDGQDLPHIAYVNETNGELGYVHWIYSGWEFETLDSAEEIYYDPSIAIDSRNQPHISYFLGAPYNDLKYAWYGSCVDAVSIPPQTFAILALYPNPSSDYLTCLLALPEAGTVELALYDLSGRVVLRAQFEATEPTEMEAVLDVSGLASGVYTLRANQGDAQVSARAVVVR